MAEETKEKGTGLLVQLTKKSDGTYYFPRTLAKGVYTDTGVTIEELMALLQAAVGKKADGYDADKAGSDSTLLAAHRAVYDGNGNQIVETYATKDELYKVVTVKGMVENIADLHSLDIGKSLIDVGGEKKFSDVGSMYTVRTGGDSFTIYVQRTDDNGVIYFEESEIITTQGDDDFIYTGAYDEVMTKQNDGVPVTEGASNDANWMYVGTKSYEVPFSITEGAEVSYELPSLTSTAV